MEIGTKLRELREGKHLSQGDIEKRTGLLRCYTSRVENGYTVPSVATLEKYARALEVPLYTLFHDGAGRIEKPDFEVPTSSDVLWGARGKERSELRLFAKALSKMNERKRKLLFAIAQQMANR